MDKKLGLLVVEDEKMLLEAITKKLQHAGLDVTSYESGKQAVEYLNQATNLPDAVWLDYHLKDMDGLEFMAELKKNEKLANLPVIVVSNSASSDKIQHMLALGAKKYVLKAEHRLDEIISTIEDLMK